jgi:UDP-N-acetylmuramate dehydrogenase
MKPLRDLFNESIRGEIIEQARLGPRTTYKIGGPARFFICPRDFEDLQCLNALLRREKLPAFVLGGGANILCSDAGFNGVVIHLGLFNQLTINGQQVVAGAGVMLDHLIRACLRHSLAGLERLSGIPGSVGGALRMNAGAFDSEISCHLESVEIMNAAGSRQWLDKTEVGFSYRRASAIQESYILGARFYFPPGCKEHLFELREEILARRLQKQPWQYPSAGSVFKRPSGHFAGQLIEAVGLKGKTIGRAQISPKHAGFIINLGGARAEEVLALIQLVQQEVRLKFKVDLELEQELIGF